MKQRMVAVLMGVALIGPSAAWADLEPVLASRNIFSWHSVTGTPAGNPVAPFMGDISTGKVMRERLTGTARWILSADLDSDGSDEAIILFDDGNLRFLSLTGSRLRTRATARGLSPEAPPAVLSSLGGEPYLGVVAVDDGGDLVAVSFDGARTTRLDSGYSPLSAPVPADLDGDGTLEIAAVGDKGELKVVMGRSRVREESGVRLLPDTRLALSDLDGDGTRELVALIEPVEVDQAGATGDNLEATGFGVFSLDGRSVSLERDFTLDRGEVITGIKPMVGEGIDGGRNLVILPVRDSDGRSSLRSYSFRTSRIREVRKGPWLDDTPTLQVLGFSNLGDRSRRFIISAAYPEKEEPLLVLFRDDLVDRRLTRSGDISAMTMGTRSVDGVLIGDFDGDGDDDLIAPGEGQRSLNHFYLSGNRVSRREIYTGSNAITSNLCPGDFDGNGWPDLAVGLDGGSLLFIMGQQ